MDAIVIKDLKKTYANGHQALKGVSFSIKEGDFFALLGPNGAGKTTIIGILTGLVNKTAGQVTVLGHDLDRNLDLVKLQIGVVPQEFNFNIFEKVLDIIVSQAGYYGIPRKVALPRAEKILKALDLWEKREVASRTLSGGMKRRLMIARGLIHEPKILVLDEPTAGVDVELRRGMWDYLIKLNQAGTTILLTTHYLEEVEQLCRNVAVLRQGDLLKLDTVKAVLLSVGTQTFQLTTDKTLTDAPSSFRHIDGHEWEIDVTPPVTITEVVELVKKHGASVVDIRPKSNRLESFFLDLVKN
ncbi:ABC transporter ATP-binding protein [Candidatus Gracilibacteria bacterium]|nr:ABC transporter ATP-binding protein [Candidatus Gracilibacteria bacterium]